MKKIFGIIFFLILVISSPAFASDDNSDDSVSDGMLKYTNTFENGFMGQKQITDEEFDKVYKQVKEKQDKKKKKKNKNIPKGKNFNQEDSSEPIGETAEKNILMSVPLELINGDGTEIPVGHYKIVGEKTDNQVYLNFYQSAALVAKVPAIETNSDFGKMQINFAELQPYSEKRVRVIFGSMDFNAYTFINIENPISDTN